MGRRSGYPIRKPEHQRLFLRTAATILPGSDYEMTEARNAGIVSTASVRSAVLPVNADGSSPAEFPTPFRRCVSISLYPAFTSTALSNSITLSPVESSPSRARSDTSRHPGRLAIEAMAEHRAGSVHRLAGIDRLQPFQIKLKPGEGPNSGARAIASATDGRH